MIKTLLGQVKEYKKVSLIVPVLVTLEVVLDIIIPLIMALLIDQGIEKGDMNKILYYGGILVALAIVALIFGALSGRYAAIASSGLAKNLRKTLFGHIQELSFANIDKFSNSSLITRMTTDVTNVQNAYQMIIRILIRSPLMFIFSLMMAFRINSTLAMTFLYIIPILAIGLFLMIRFAFPVFDRVFKMYDRLNKVVQENLQGIRVVKSFVREDHEKEKFEDVSEDMFKNFSLAQRIVATNGPLMQFSMNAAMLLISWVGAKLVVTSQMSTGELVSMFTYVGQILISLNMLSMVFVMMMISRTSARRITEVLNEESTLTNLENPVMEIPDGSVSFENVNFSYVGRDEKNVLRDINFRIEPGEVVGIIGGTGSAKSTLVQLIPRLYDVTCGAVKVGGRDVREYDIEALRDAVAMVLQQNVLFSGTIKENLRWGNSEATDKEIERVAKIAQADSFIQELPDKYETVLTQGGTNVSGGQKQRLTIARALLKKPKILIMDDSTSAVDTKTDYFIRSGLKEEIPGTTTFIIAQRISSIQDADKIIVLEKGQINGIGTHEELMQTNEIYQEVQASQQKGFGQHEEG
ncbi:ABC transporter ATP-binding protein [Vagococcus silagei]|uniref:ABC transporter ATP-binding protein n=1 Tax=Vagococcus silagei TaxID=2508885 RepID=A0A4S3B227_9ENTE|nr:ABC transporter ATP-binding protein [Vagococcus silagei]THB60832.1 ABC transporter ATP-binding protein [Vagococcus silagei]